MLGIKKEVLITAAVAIAAVAAVAFVQRHVIKLPVVGGYLPQ